MENTARSTRSPSSIKLGLVPTLSEVNGRTVTDFSRKETELIEVISLKQGRRWSCTPCKSSFSLPHMVFWCCSTQPTTPGSRCHLLISQSLVLSPSLGHKIPRGIIQNSGKNWNPTLFQNRKHRTGSFYNPSKQNYLNYPQTTLTYRSFHSY